MPASVVQSRKRPILLFFFFSSGKRLIFLLPGLITAAPRRDSSIAQRTCAGAYLLRRTKTPQGRTSCDRIARAPGRYRAGHDL